MGPAARTTIVDVPQTHWARTVDGASIAYQDIGDGPVTLVVIHGWVSHLEVYWEQPRYVRFVRRLSRDMRVLLFDKRGIGMSDRVAGAPDLGVLLDDVRAVMDAAGVERAALLGWGDPGPQLAAFFAATHPERTLCLALSGSLHARWEPDYPWGETEDQFEEHIRETVHHWGTLAGASAFIRRGYCGDDLERLKVPPYNQPEFADWNARLARFSATPSSFEAFERMWFLTDIRPLLASIAVPTAVFFVAGDRDDEDHARAQRDLIPTAVLVPSMYPNEVVWVRDAEPLVGPLEEFISTVEHEDAQLDRTLATVLFTDVVGSTDKACELGDARWAELLTKHHAITRSLIARYRGVEVGSAGDGFLATFDGPARAVRCGQAICSAVRSLGLEVRAGCHTGEIELLGDDVGGIAVHIGARVSALAGRSEVLVTSTVKDLVAGSDLVFEDRGEQRLKGIPEPWHIWALTVD